MPGRRFPTVLIAGLLLALGLLAVGCGEREEPSAKQVGSGHEGRHATRSGDSAERAFLSAMVPHHEAAIEMAEVAQKRGRAREIRALADSILGAQAKEIGQMKAIHRRLFGTELTPDERAHERLGLSAREAGMDHAGAATNLRNAEPFDRAFVDEMAPHHGGAIRMSNVALKRSSDRELRALARTIVTTQKQEIERMNAFRRERFGGPVPRDGGHGAHETMEGH